MASEIPAAKPFTRFGQLKLSPEGVLETANGYAVIGEAGPITIPLPVKNINISRDGTIMVQPEGAPANVQEEVARIKLVNPDTRMLEKGNDGLFRMKDGSAVDADITVSSRQGGALESSNVNPNGEMTDMIALTKTI